MFHKVAREQIHLDICHGCINIDPLVRCQPLVALWGPFRKQTCLSPAMAGRILERFDMTLEFNRRSALALGAAALAAPSLGRASTPIDALEFWGPPAGPSIILAHAIEAGLFEGVIAKPSLRIWRNPDELRAGLTGKQIEVSIVPTQAAANLYNRGFPLRLINIMTQGLLYVINNGPADQEGLDVMRGRRVAMPFKNDTPDIILKRLMAHAGIDPEKDTEMVHVGSHIEAVQMMVLGRADCALLTEPATSGAIMMAAKAGRTLTRAVDVQEAWGAMNGADPVIPQAGLAGTGAFVEANKDALPALNAALKAAAQSTLQDPAISGANAAKTLPLPGPVISDSIPYSRLGAWEASQMRTSIEDMFNTMAEVDIRLIGGKLPDDGFYV